MRGGGVSKSWHAIIFEFWETFFLTFDFFSKFGLHASKDFVRVVFVRKGLCPIVPYIVFLCPSIFISPDISSVWHVFVTWDIT